MVVLRPYLDRAPEAYCFSPAESVAWNRARQRKRPAGGRELKPVRVNGTIDKAK
jgi:hypothetical protein